MEKKSSSNRDSVENDQLMQRLRHIQQDIRHRRSKQLANQASVQAAAPPVQQPQRPSIQAAKSLDLQYYPMKQTAITPKSAVVRIVQPNGNDAIGPNFGNAFKPIQQETVAEPLSPNRNRIRLVRSAARDEPDEPPPVVMRPAEQRSMAAATNGNRHSMEFNGQHDSMGNAFKPIQTIHPKPSQLVSLDQNRPNRSTYF